MQTTEPGSELNVEVHLEGAAAVSEARPRQRYFLSYAGVDRPAALALEQGLRDAKLEVWCDVQRDALEKGVHWVRALEEALDTSAGYVVVVGQATLRGWVRAEFEFALGRNAWNPDFRIVPLLLPGVTPSELTGFLKIFQAVQLTEISNAPLERWGNSEFSQVALKIASSSYRFDDSICPFPGLGCFDEDQSGFYFGREADVRAALHPLVDAPRRRRWLQVEGASGAGKSSFARAGLLPAVRRGWLASGPFEGTTWDIAIVRPLTSPIVNLATQLYHSLPASGAGQSIEALTARLQSTASSLSAIVRERRLPGHHFVLLVDQLEEIFTLSDQRQALDLPAIKHFAELLRGLLDDVDLPATLITTVRSDFTKHMVGLDPFASALNRHAYRYCLPPLRGADLSRVIRDPATRLGLQIGDLAEKIIKDVGDKPSALPLVAHALRLLWIKRDRGQLSSQTYKDFGGIEGALSKSAGNLFKEVGHPERVQRLFLGLVRVNKDGTVTRRPLPREQAVRLAGGDELAEKILLQLSGGTSSAIRLVVITVETDAPDKAQVDLVHEALLQGSEQLAEWIERDKKVVQRRGDLEHAAERWEKGPPVKSDDGLARGASLVYYEAFDLAEGERRRYVEDAEPIALEFLQESELAAERERRHRRWLQIGSVVAALVLLVAVGIVWSQSRENQRSEAARNGALASLYARAPGQEVDAALTALRALGPNAGGADEPAILDGLSEAAAVASRISMVVERQRKGLMGAAFSPDERFVLIFGEADDPDAREHPAFCELLQLETGKKLRLLAHTRVIWSGTFSRQGDQIVTASTDGTAVIWDASRAAELLASDQSVLPPKHILTAPAAKHLRHADFSPDGTRVVTAGYGGTAIWSTKTGARIDLPHPGDVTHAEFSSEGDWVASSSADGRARLWDARTGRLAIAFNADAPLNYASLSPDGSKLATAGENGSVSIFNVGARTADMRGQESILSRGVGDLSLSGHARAATGAVFSPDGRKLLTTSVDTTARIWDSESGQTVCTLSGHAEWVRAASWSPDGRNIATASHDQTARLWDASSCGLLAIYRAHGSWVVSAAFTRDGQQLLTAGWEGEVRLWGTKAGQYEQQLLGHTASVTDVAWSATGELASSSKDNTLRIWDLANGTDRTITTPVGGGAVGVQGVRWDENGGVLSAGGDGVARLWNTKTLKEVTHFPHGEQKRLNDAAFSPDGAHVVTSGDEGMVKVWRTNDAASPVAMLPAGEAARSARFSPDGTRLLIASWELSARVWTWGQDAPVQRLGGHTAALYFGEWSPDGKQLLTAGTEVRVWSTASPDEATHVLSVHQYPVQHAVFSPNGTKILTSSRDGTAMLWDAADGAPLMTLRGHGGPVSRAAFSRNGTKVATASDDGSVLIYNLDPRQLALMVCSNLERAPEYVRPENLDIRQTCARLYGSAGKKPRDVWSRLEQRRR